MKPLATIAALFIAATAAADHRETRELRLSGSGIETLVIDAGGGSLEVEGGRELEDIQVTAEIFVNRSGARAREFVEKAVELNLTSDGPDARLHADIDDDGFGSWFRDTRSEINLTVRIPAKLDLRIDDGSGGSYITGIDGNVWVDDGSGSFEIETVGGNVEIDDGSGSLDIVDVRGDVEVDDGSGSLTIRNVGGNVVIDDGSGSITIDDIGGDVRILDGGSGSLHISNVRGTIHAEDD